MVKLQKPIPKNMGNKAKFDNPIKKKKQQTKKEQSSGKVKNIKAELLESPIKEANLQNKPVKKVGEKKKDTNKAKLVQKQSAKVEVKAVVPPAVPEKQKDDKSGKKNNKKTEKNAAVMKNGENKVGKPSPVGPAKAAALKQVVAPVKAAKAAVPAKAAKIDAPAKAAKVAVPPKATKPAAPAKPAKVKAPAKAVKSAAPSKAAKVAGPVKTPKIAGPVKTPKIAGPVKAPKIAAAAQAKVVPPVALPVKVVPQKNVDLAKKLTDVPAKGPKASKKLAKGKKNKNKKKVVEADETPTEKKPKLAKKKPTFQDKKKSKIAFMLAKKKQEKKEKVPSALKFEPVPFDEDTFNAIVNEENIKKIATALKTQVEKEVSEKKFSIFDDYRYYLQVACFKIPNCPKRMVKLNLKHPLVEKNDDVLLIVPDLQRGAKFDFEPTKHHYEDLLRAQGVEGITVMPMNQLRKEYTTFEQKRRLCASYDHYLCDGRIVSHVVGFIGKLAQKPRRTFHGVRMNKPENLKSEIEKSMRRTSYRQVAKSPMQSIPVGHHKYDAHRLAENIAFVVKQLKKLYPGGLGNVRNLYLKIDIVGTSALPLYISMAQAPETTPTIVGPREERMIKLKREANEVLSKFAMNKEGKLIKLKKKQVERKRELQEMRSTLQADEVAAKKAKKTKTDEEVNDLELPENEEDDDDDTSDGDDDAVQGSSDDDDNDEIVQEEDDEDSVDAESETEIVENGLVDDTESEGEDQQQASDGGDDDDDDDDDNEDDDDDDDEEGDESD